MPEKTQEGIKLSPSAGPFIVPPSGNPDVPEDEEHLKQELVRLTPSNEKLRKLAANNPPPTEYFEGEEEMPFDPVKE